MKTIPNRIKYIFVLTLLCAISVIFMTCSKKDKKPEITGCNTIEYDGKTYSNVGCAPGIASFDVSINDSPTFHVTCSSGCISSVRLAENDDTIIGPVYE